MTKKLYAILAAIALTCSIFYACGGDDNKEPVVDEVWKAFNDSIYEVYKDSATANAGAKDPLLFQSRTCLTGNGDIYYKTINEFKIVPPPSVDDSKYSTKITKEGTPYSNDSVLIRFEGWFYYKDIKGEIKKYEFDGTEFMNQTAGIKVGVSGTTNALISSGNTRARLRMASGMISQLQNMKVNEQRQICIPYKIGYGEYGISQLVLGDNSSRNIPGYTTLFFNIVLLKIYPINPGEFPDAETGDN